MKDKYKTLKQIKNMKYLIFILLIIIIFTSILPYSVELKTHKDSTNQIDTIGSDIQVVEDDDKLTNELIIKNKLIKEKIISKGHKYRVIRISSFRNEKENNLLPLSAKNSFHLHGKAIDVIVLDINNDFRVNNKDVDLFLSIIKEVERENPKLIGGIGTYKNSWYSKQMVHFDTRGYATFWNY